MDVVLDSNVFRGDFNLKSTGFDILLDYLEKTQSNVIMPNIVWDETLGLYKREFELRLNKFNSCRGNINLLLTDEQKHINALEFNITKEVESFGIFVKNKLKIRANHFLPYNDSYLQEIVKRAINREKPCGQEGQGFRDALIWLTIKEYTRTSLGRQIIFISNNSSDFGYKDKLGLHESLQEECEKLDIKIKYFRNIEEFIKEHSSKIDYINIEWIKSSINVEEISALVTNFIISGDPAKLHSYVQEIAVHYLIGIYSILKTTPYEYSNVIVYEMLDGKLIVHCNVYCTLTVDSLESLGKSNGLSDLVSTENTIQIIASLSLIVEKGIVIEKSINSVNYYNNI
ncbi:MAG: PIN domain-containing protein [Bacteroidota bacterium]|nr:PIN domain-containing protein [Bacteroidota bacterium]